MRYARYWIFVLFLTQACLGDPPLAMVTKIHGAVRVKGQNLELLSYLSENDQADLAPDSSLTLSYVKGGVRATVVGPARIQVQGNKPVLLTGKPDQLQLVQPDKRVGVALPANVDLGSGGSLRRGEVSLHLSRKLLPGLQSVDFSALPSYRTFRLEVENSSTFERVFESEEAQNGSFSIPDGCLKPGQSYDFLLQATSDGGTTKEVREESVVVLSQELADGLRQKADEVAHTPTQSPAGVELLALYLSYGLDREALQLVDRLSEGKDSATRLHELRKTLRSRLQYQP